MRYVQTILIICLLRWLTAFSPFVIFSDWDRLTRKNCTEKKIGTESLTWVFEEVLLKSTNNIPEKALQNFFFKYVKEKKLLGRGNQAHYFRVHEQIFVNWANKTEISWNTKTNPTLLVIAECKIFLKHKRSIRRIRKSIIIDQLRKKLKPEHICYIY